MTAFILRSLFRCRGGCRLVCQTFGWPGYINPIALGVRGYAVLPCKAQARTRVTELGTSSCGYEVEERAIANGISVCNDWGSAKTVSKSEWPCADDLCFYQLARNRRIHTWSRSPRK